MSFVVGVGLDVVSKSSNVRVDTGVSLNSASVSPGYNTNLLAVDGDGTTRVTLAGVLAGFTSADHAGGHIAIIGFVAGGTVDDGYIDSLEVGGKAATTRGEGSPSGNLSGLASGGFSSAEGNGGLRGGESEGSGELEHGHVVVEVALSESGVLSDGGDLGDGTTRFEF